MFIILLLVGCNGLPVTNEKPITQDTPQLDLTQIMTEIPAIHFRVGSSRLTKKARRQIRGIALLLNRSGVIKEQVLVFGHSDAVGSAKKNMMISDQRADSVIRELVLNGVRPSRLTKIVKGESQPLKVDASAEGSQDVSSLNRRVEIVLESVTKVEVR